jgi:hypothetical protein
MNYTPTLDGIVNFQFDDIRTNTLTCDLTATFNGIVNCNSNVNTYANTNMYGNLYVSGNTYSNVIGNITSSGTSSFNSITSSSLNVDVISINSSGIYLPNNGASNNYGRVSMGDILTIKSGGHNFYMQLATGTTDLMYIQLPTANSAFQFDIGSSSGVFKIYNNLVQATAFNATSDYRIKENITEITETIDNLKPVKYFNKLTDKIDYGFVAHELHEIFPEMVNGTKDEIDDEGKPKYQSVNYISLIAVLVKELKDLKQRTYGSPATPPFYIILLMMLTMLLTIIFCNKGGVVGEP